VDSSFFENLGARGLAGEVAWLRTLAASLVRDPDEAEDLAGEVWVQALARRPAVSDERPLRAWLTVVLRRLASRRRREGDSRRERELRAARPEHIPGADDPIERVELQRKLVEAVLALSEPYRSAVVLRHLEQLSIPEIAHRQSCTPEAARQRVARGLQQLRARLDRAFDGGRDGWRALLVPFAAHAPIAGTAGLAGAIAVSSKTVAALILCVVAGLLFWWWPEPSRAQLDSASLLGGDSMQGPDSQSGNISGLEAPQDAWSRDTAGPLIRRPRLAGKVVDSSGVAMAGVSVSFSSESGFSAPGVETDASGHFERELDAQPAEGAPIEATVESVEHCETTAIVTTREEATIVMAKLPRIEVRVVGPEGLAPEGSGNVKLLLRDKHGTRTTSLELDEDGIARSDPVQPGQLLRVNSTFDGFACHAVTRNDQLLGDATLRVDVTLARGVTLRGTVLDEHTHRPLSGVIVRAEPLFPLTWADAPNATTDGSGNFELRAVTASRHMFAEDRSMIDCYYVNVEIDGYALLTPKNLVWKHPIASPQPAVVDDIELLLVPTGTLIVKLRWPGGRDVGYMVVLRVFDSAGHVFETGQSSGGECGLTKVPAGDLSLIARALDPRGLARTEFSLRVGEVKRIDLTLQSPDAAVEGRVVDDQGRGVPGVVLGAENFIEVSDNRTSLDWPDTQTDAQGAFRFEALYPGSLEIAVANGEDLLPMAFWPPLRTVALDAAGIATGVEFRSAPAVQYSGSVAPLPALDDSRPLFVELTHAEFGSIGSSMVEPGGGGRFELTAMPGIDYVLIARRGGKVLGSLAVPQAGTRNLILPIGP